MSAAAASGEIVVVLDDDPTGTQAVSDVPVLTSWRQDDLRWAFRQHAPAVFLSLNTRSLPVEEARARVAEATAGALQAAAAEGRAPVFASRSDSTLRGHFPLETDAVADALGAAVDGVLIVPAFLESGRITVDSVHYVVGPDGRVPAAQTEFARDATFGYRSSDLREWVEEKTAGRWRAADVARITLDDIRSAGADALVAILHGLSGARPVVVDAETEDDLALVADAVRRAERGGRTLVYRVGPSFVRARAGLGPPTRLDASRLGEIHARCPATGRGLVVVGSHVAMTTEQLEHMRDLDGVGFVEVDAPALLDERSRASAIDAAAGRAACALERSEVVVHTSRALLSGDGAEASLAIARSISRALVALVRRIVARAAPRWVIAKGGITSNDVGAYGLGIRRAWVRGSLLAGGVSLWEPVGGATRVPFVVFPGNVGGPDGLRQAVLALREAA